VPDSPFYTAAVGWDAVTGWGSINGRRLLAGIAPAAIVVTMVEDNGQFGDVCVGKSADRVLTITIRIRGAADLEHCFLERGIRDSECGVVPAGGGAG